MMTRRNSPSNPLYHVFLPILLGALITSCSGTSDPAVVGKSNEPPPGGVLGLSPSTFVVKEGDSLALRVQLNATKINASQVSWSVVPATAGAVNKDGVFLAWRYGEVTVTANYALMTASSQGTIQPTPQGVEPISPAELNGTVGQTLFDPVVVRITGATGDGIAGVKVAFQPEPEHGTVSDSVVYTDGDGDARTYWTLGPNPGRQSLRAWTEDVKDTETVFLADALPDYSAPRMRIHHGNEQEGQVASVLPQPLTVIVEDTLGNPLPGMAVEWSFSDGGGSFWSGGSLASAKSPEVTVTDTEGKARIYWIAGTVAGDQEAYCAPVLAGSLVSGQNGAARSGAASGIKGETSKFKAKVRPGPASKVEIDPFEVWSEVGDEVQLSAVVADQYDNPVDGAEISWKTDRTGTISVSEYGVVRALKPGRGSAIAASPPAKGSVYVYVSEVAPASAQIVGGDGQQGEAGQGLGRQVEVEVLDANGSPVAGAGVDWEILTGGGSVGSGLSSTDETGIARNTWTLGTEAGNQSLQAVVTGLEPMVFSAEAQPGPVTSVSLLIPFESLLVGEKGRLQAYPEDVYGNAVSGAQTTWASSDPGILTIDSGGLVEGVAEGMASVSATVSGVEASGSIQVIDDTPTISFVTVTPSHTSVEVGSTATLSAAAFDGSGARVREVSIKWSSDHPEIASVPTNGLVLGVEAGTATIRATAGGVSGTSQVTVTDPPPPVAAIEINPSSLEIEVGTTGQFSAEALDASGQVISGVSMNWTSSSPGVATVEQGGRVTGVAPGEAEIRASVEGVTKAAQVRVVSAETPKDPPGGVNDLSASGSGETAVTLRWTQVSDGDGQPADYAVRYGTPTISWGSAYPTEVSLSGTAIGAPLEFQWTGLQPDTEYQFRLVAYRGTLNAGAVFGALSNVLTVRTSDLTPEVASVDVSPSALTLTALQETVQLSAVAADSLGNEIPGINFDWSTTNTEIASVTNMGSVKAKSAGTVFIIAAATCCGSADTVRVTVEQEPYSLRILPDSVTLNVGVTQQLAASVKDRNGYPVYGRTVQWSSSDPSLAQVSGSGLVTALAEGSVDISAQVAGISDAAGVKVVEPNSPPPPGEGAFFQDGFESGDFSHTENGGKWGSKSRVSAQPGTGRTGNYSARFKMGPNDDNQDSWSELRFNMGRQMPEVWVEAWVKVPDNYTTRQPSDGATNDKLFVMWHDGQYPGGGAQTSFSLNMYPSPTGSGYSSMALFWADTEHLMKSSWAVWARDFITPDLHGKWVHLAIHARLGIGGGTVAKGDPNSGTGVVEVWWDGSKIIDEHQLAWDPASQAYLQKGYLMGWSNMGYDAETFWYWDDVKFYSSDPGW